MDNKDIILSQDALYIPIEAAPSLNHHEKRAIVWFLSYGRASFTFSCFLSIPACITLYRWPTNELSVSLGIVALVVWGVSTLSALCFAAPIIFQAILNLVRGIPKEQRANLKKFKLLGAVLLGWDRYFKKKGRPKQGLIVTPEDFLEVKGEAAATLIETVKCCIDEANKLLGGDKKKYRTSLIRGVFDALEQACVIKDEYRCSYESYEQFLISLGGNYRCGEKSLRKSPLKTVLYKTDNIDYQKYVTIVKGRIRLN